ncbi:MAG: hypothetical protein JXA92_12630 [candidate division Zixibacteria bacterium]|nr:hypothetical protein [candidate division Zixibacteria bacterium]
MKTSIKIFIFLAFAFGYVVLNNLPYLPGPDNLYDFSNSAHDYIGMLGLLGLVAVPIGITWLVVRLVKVRKVAWWPVIFILSGILVLCNGRYIEPLFRDHARERSIREAGVLIRAIESYRNSEGFYPVELSQLIPEYIDSISVPSSMGSKEFVYRRTDETFEVEFYQNVIMNFNIEVVVYNPLDRQESRGGIPFLYETGHEHWKYCILD